MDLSVICLNNVSYVVGLGLIKITAERHNICESMNLSYKLYYIIY